MAGNVTQLEFHREPKLGVTDVQADPLLAVEHLLRGCLSLTQSLCPERTGLNAALFDALLCCVREQEAEGRPGRL